LSIQNHLCHNGKIISADQTLIEADNRAFRYGDGLFETMRYVDGNIPLASYHFSRLFRGLQTLFFDAPSYYTEEYFIKQIIELCKKNEHNPARVRLMIYRGNGSIKDPQNHFPYYIIQTWSLPNRRWQWNENGLVLGVCSEIKKSYDTLSSLKHNNHLPYLYAAHYAQQQQWNDAIILNTSDRIVDTSIANVFIIKNDTIITPSLSEACVAGTVRQYLIDQLSTTFSIREASITVQDMEEANEVFLTNAIRGVQWVKTCNEKTYANNIAKKVFEYLM